MAKSTSKSKTPSKSTGKSAFKPQVHVRMYRQGLGDCFLLRFETEEDVFFDVLIDCGIYKASPEAGELMNQVVDHVIKTTDNHLDLLVVTHEHWDHISGFSQALDKFDGMTIDQVWQAWTEDPSNTLANELREKYEKTKARLVGLMRRADLALNSRKVRALDDAFSIMSFFGIDRNPDEDDPYRKIKELLAKKKPVYRLPGEVLPLGKTKVKVFVLGPPVSEKTLRKQDIAKKDAYEKQHLAFLDGLETMLAAVESGIDGDADADRMNRPFAARQEVSIDVARQSEFFQTLYGFDSDHPEYFRSIDDLAYDTLGGLALRMDKYINNTSLVLAFRLPNNSVLLFPGDAQGGNWKSWADPDAPLKFESEKTDAHQLLASTVLYKVAHHGSHNATPRTYGLERMTHRGLRALVPVDHAIAQQARYGEMPLVGIMDALTAKTGGAVFRSDCPADQNPHKVFRCSKERLTIRITKDGPTIERPLYCETSFDLE